MHVEQIAEPGPEWDAFAEATPGAALGHAAGWARVLKRAYGLEPCYLAARGADGALAGVLPLTCFRTITGQQSLVSMPFLDSGGVLARDDDTARALLEAALARVRERGARALELRQPGPHAALPVAPEQHRVDLVLRLEGDEEAQWKAVGSKVRNQTRKAEREGLELATGDAASLLEGFYDPFRVNMRDLGSPVHARAFFAEAAEAFGERLRFVVTTRDGRSVGGLVAIDYAGCVTVPWASTLRSERRRCPNNQIYWEALRWAIARGAREFDFGRSPRESGTFRFKAGWGAEERELAWLQLSPEGEALPPGADASGLLQKVSDLWTRLPQPVTDALGPRIRRFFSN